MNKSQEYKILVEDKLKKYFQTKGFTYDGLLESMNYSLMAGGKRIRPILVLEFSRISGGSIEDTLPIACAIEMLHTYSLIHDDLPCMDNDDLRRGKPTNHILYGECTATLAGDALQAEAFRTIMESNLPAERKVECAQILSQAVGANGMCAGQYLDMLGEGHDLTENELIDINIHKTGALLIAACKMGVAAAGGSDDELAAAENYGYNIGLAFQIRDDVLDVISTAEEFGKPIGSDKDENKNTYMALYGQEKCEKLIHELTADAKDSIRNVFNDYSYLIEIADSMETRRK